jgi:hypothetical protein
VEPAVCIHPSKCSIGRHASADAYYLVSVCMDERKACSDLNVYGKFERKTGGQMLLKYKRWDKLFRRHISDAAFDVLKPYSRLVPGTRAANDICDTATGQLLVNFQKQILKRENSSHRSSTHRADQRPHCGTQKAP